MKLRRLSPVPAGVGIPDSIAGRPLPAWATPRRRNEARLKSWQAQPRGGEFWLISAGLVVGACDDERAQRVQRQDRVLLALPLGARRGDGRGGRVPAQRRLCR